MDWKYLIIAIICVVFAFYCLSVGWVALLRLDYDRSSIHIIAGLGAVLIGLTALETGERAKRRVLREQAISGKPEVT